MKTQGWTGLLAGLGLAAGLLCAVAGCDGEDSSLAPYEGAGRELSAVSVEESTLVPRINWLGGYATVLGVNKGKRAVLDASLVWLVSRPADALSYPVKYGTLPSGGQDLTGSYGGTVSPTLVEDTTYTYWVMKAEAWSQVSQKPNRTLLVDSSVTGVLTERNDTVLVNPLYLAEVTERLDLYINVKSVQTRGQLCDLQVYSTDSTSQLWVTYRVKQAGVTDTMIAAIGVVQGGQYSVNAIRWEMISEDLSITPPVYYKNNVISSPIRMGVERAGTKTFTFYPAGGLERGKQYYLWVASKEWDGVNRLRSTPYYAFATFDVW